MEKKVYVFDPTVTDKQSRVRGIGRYLEIMKENLSNDFIFTSQKNIPYDAVLVNPFFNLLQLPFSFKKIAHKQITIIHDLIPQKYPQHFPIGIRGKINYFLNRLNLSNYDLIITQSEAGKKDIINLLNVPGKKIQLINPTLPQIFWNNQSPITNHQSPVTNYCLYVGDATWNKNLVNLARAIKLADVKCIFAGKVFENKNNLDHSWQQELKDFYAEIKDDPHFILKGYVNDQELIKLYQNAVCNILISHDEGFGFSYVEALSQNCPSLLADTDISHEIALDTAVYVDQNQPQLIAKKIQQFFQNKNLRTQVLRNKKRVLDKYNQQQFKQQWLKSIK